MWTLVIFIHASVLASGDSVALTNVVGFESQEACVSAGERVKSFDKGTTKVVKTMCFQVSTGKAKP